MSSPRLTFFCLLLSLLPCAAAVPRCTLAQVRALSDESALAGQRVRIQGTVLYADPANESTIIHDGTAASYCGIRRDPGGSTTYPKVGDRILVEGITRLPGISPQIDGQKWTLLGHGEIPEPHKLSAEEMYQMFLDATWVEVPAVVTGVETGVETGGTAYTLAVDVFGQTFKADVPTSPDAAQRVAALMQRPARMRAILCTVCNEHRQMIGRHFYLPSLDDIRPIAPAESAVKTPLLTTLQLLSRSFSPADLVRVEGVVTQEGAKGFYLRDGSASAQVQAVKTESLPPGTRVSVEGYGVIARFRPMLRAIEVKRIASGPPPEPLAMKFPASDNSLLEMELVRLDADLLNSRDFQDETILECRNNGTIFKAILPHSATPPPVLLPGDRLQLTGICELTTTQPLSQPIRANGFRIRLADSAAVVLLSHAPWWTTSRLLAALGAMTGIALLGALGTFIFGGAVRRQAGVLGEKLGTEAVSDERERMARDLHDTLEQQLAGVALQLDGLDKVAQVDPSQISSRLSLARRMLRHTRVEARRSVWDLRSRVLELQGLGTALRSMAQGASSEEGPAVSLDIGELSHPLPHGSDFHLLRIAQEALANAIKHAAAHEVVISLRETTDAVVLIVRDNGCGYVPEPPDAPITSHFGLLGMRERVEKIGATLHIQSSPGNGCTVTVTLPISPSMPR